MENAQILEFYLHEKRTRTAANESSSIKQTVYGSRESSTSTLKALCDGMEDDEFETFYDDYRTHPGRRKQIESSPAKGRRETLAA